MDKDERAWIDDAILLCAKASEKNVVLLLHQDIGTDGNGDVMVTNAASPETIHALGRAIAGEYAELDDDG